jgi:hypothetical protein
MKCPVCNTAGRYLSTTNLANSAPPPVTGSAGTWTQCHGNPDKSSPRGNDIIIAREFLALRCTQQSDFSQKPMPKQALLHVLAIADRGPSH